MTEQQQREARERLEAATPGPWLTDADGTGVQADVKAGLPYANMVCRVWPNMGNREADAALIAAAPTDLRLALDALDRVRAEIAEWAAVLPGGRALAALIQAALDGPDAV